MSNENEAASSGKAAPPRPLPFGAAWPRCLHGPALVGVGGFEPPASWPQTRRSNLTELHPVAPLQVKSRRKAGQSETG